MRVLGEDHIDTLGPPTVCSLARSARWARLARSLARTADRFARLARLAHSDRRSLGGGEPQSSSSSLELEATRDGAAELAEGGEGGHASSSSGQEPSEVASDWSSSSSS